MESDLDMVIGFNNIDASLRDKSLDKIICKNNELKKDTSLNNVKLFLDETFSSGVSIENVFDSLGGNFSGLVFFLQSFEVWLEKRTKIKTVGKREECSTCIWHIDNRCTTKKGCERYSGWEPK